MTPHSPFCYSGFPMAGVETAKGIFFPKIKYASAFDNFTPEIMNHYESFDESVSKVITELEAAYANPARTKDYDYIRIYHPYKLSKAVLDGELMVKTKDQGEAHKAHFAVTVLLVSSFANSPDSAKKLAGLKKILKQPELIRIKNASLREEPDTIHRPDLKSHELADIALDIFAQTGDTPLLVIGIAHAGTRYAVDEFLRLRTMLSQKNAKNSIFDLFRYSKHYGDSFVKLTHYDEDKLKRESKGRTVVVIGTPDRVDDAYSRFNFLQKGNYDSNQVRIIKGKLKE